MSTDDRLARALVALAETAPSDPPIVEIRQRARAARRRRRRARGATILTANLFVAVLVGVGVTRLTATTDDPSTTLSIPVSVDEQLRDAARTGDLAAVERLLRAGASPDAPGRFGLTALSIAVVRDDGPMTRSLLAADADPHLRVETEATALHLAARYASPEIVAAVLDTSPDLVDQRDARIATPLHVAMARGDTTIVGLLLAAGADPAAPDGHLRRPVHHALDGTDPLPVIRHLLADVDQPLIEPITDLDEPLIDFTVELTALTDAELLAFVAATDPDRR